MSTASKVAEDKLNHPWKLCPVNRCLWKTGDGSYCPRHKQHKAMEIKGESNEETTEQQAAPGNTQDCAQA